MVNSDYIWIIMKGVDEEGLEQELIDIVSPEAIFNYRFNLDKFLQKDSTHSFFKIKSIEIKKIVKVIV